MSYINNMNPRRMIWFNQNAPKNKMDLWLSYNRHYEDTSEDETTDPQQTTDNPNQRNCDLILKVWDCGNWVPIVGFNSTAAHKIDTVNGTSYQYTIDGSSFTSEGKEEFDLPLFTKDSPSELFSAGPLGEALNKFVTDEWWKTIYNSHLKTIIEQYPFDLWPAEPAELGGIYADRFTSTHNDTSTANKTWMAQCKYKYNASNNYNLYVHAKDVISAIYTYTTDNPSSQTLPIPLATYEEIGGARIQTDNTSEDYRGAPVLFGGPNVGLTYGGNTPDNIVLYGDSTTYNPDNSFLYVPAWAIMDILKNPYNEQTPQPFVTGWKGIDTQLRDNSDLVWVGLSGLIPENAGKFCMAQINQTDPSGVTIEWVDLPGGTTYTGGTGITISQQNEISIDTTGASTNQVLTKTSSGVGWTTPSQGTQYTGTNLIEVDAVNNEIGIDMSSNPSDGDVIICDSGIAKWGSAPNPSLAIVKIECGSGDLTLSSNVLSVAGGSFTINDDTYASSSYRLDEWTYYKILNYKSIAITSIRLTANPTYMRFSPRASISRFTCVGDVIDAQGVLTDSLFQEDAFVTLQFGIAKFEKVETVS